MASESLTIDTDLTVEKPDIAQLVGEDGAFGKMLCDVDSLMDSQYKKGRIKGTDYAKVLSDSIQSTIKSATDFIVQRELIAAQALYYKWQAEKAKRDSILVTSQEIKMKAELANEVLKGCFVKEQTKTQTEKTNTQIQETNKILKESLDIEKHTERLTQEIKNLKQTELKLLEETAVAHKMIAQTNAKTSNILQHTQLLEQETNHEIQKKLLTTEHIALIKNQADHEISKKLNTEADTDFIKDKADHEVSKKLDTEAHTDWMKEHKSVEHEMIEYTKQKGLLEKKRISVEGKRILLMQSEIDVNDARVPLLCAQAKVELRKVDVMGFDAIYKKVAAMVQAKEVSIKQAEIDLTCAKTKAEQTKAYLTKYQALGVLEQSKTEQVHREVMKYGILEAKSKAKSMEAQVQTGLANAQLLKQKVKTELAQGKVLEGKLELFAAQYAGLVNDAKLRNQKLKDDVRISQATLSLDGDVTGLDQEDVSLAEPTTIQTTISEVTEVTLPESDTSVEFEVSESPLPEGDTMPDLTCEKGEMEQIDINSSSIPTPNVNCPK